MIRDAEEADAGVLAAMRLCLQEHLRRANPDVWAFSDTQKLRLSETYRGFLRDPEKRIVVACRADGEIVGMAMGAIFRHEEYRLGKSGRLDDVWVSPDDRNTGLCMQMIDHLLAFFRDAGVDHITLNYVVGNAEAEAVWSRLGFKPTIVTATRRLGQTTSRPNDH